VKTWGALVHAGGSPGLSIGIDAKAMDFESWESKPELENLLQQQVKGWGMLRSRIKE
jgi:hypothetical protein